jgi:hypothetical protein
MFHIDELADRNVKYFELLNCTSEQTQLECFQSASVPDLVNAYSVLSNYKATDGSVYFA